ncbi:MAG: J domain-containing protein [Nanoarchaeota archaeon]|nr:J domain-containing protein [Nanoarchaeota archaeon]
MSEENNKILPVVSKQLLGENKEITHEYVKKVKRKGFDKDFDDVPEDERVTKLTLRTPANLPSFGSIIIPYDIYASYNFGCELYDKTGLGRFLIADWIDSAKNRYPGWEFPKNVNYRVRIDLLNPSEIFFEDIPNPEYEEMRDLIRSMGGNTIGKPKYPLFLEGSHGTMIGLSKGNVENIVELADLEKKIKGLDAVKLPKGISSNYAVDKDGAKYYTFNADHIPLMDKLRMVAKLALNQIRKNHSLDDSDILLTSKDEKELSDLLDDNKTLNKKVSELEPVEFLSLYSVLVSNILDLDNTITIFERYKGTTHGRFDWDSENRKYIIPQAGVYGILIKDFDLSSLEYFGYKMGFKKEKPRLFLPLLLKNLEIFEDPHIFNKYRNPLQIMRDSINAEPDFPVVPGLMFNSETVFDTDYDSEKKEIVNIKIKNHRVSGELFLRQALKTALKNKDSKSIEFLIALHNYINNSDEPINYSSDKADSREVLEATGEFATFNGQHTGFFYGNGLHTINSFEAKILLSFYNLEPVQELDMEALNMVLRRDEHSVESHALYTLNSYGSDWNRFFDYQAGQEFHQRAWPSTKNLSFEKYKFLFEYLAAPEIKKNFELLGLEPGAGEEEIRTAWKQKLFQLHPDITKEGVDYKQFQDVVDAKTKLMSTKIDEEKFKLLKFLGKPLEFVEYRMPEPIGMLEAKD